MPRTCRKAMEKKNKKDTAHADFGKRITMCDNGFRVQDGKLCVLCFRLYREDMDTAAGIPDGNKEQQAAEEMEKKAEIYS